jgi:hypothetical protein
MFRRSGRTRFVYDLYVGLLHNVTRSHCAHRTSWNSRCLMDKRIIRLQILCFGTFSIVLSLSKKHRLVYFSKHNVSETGFVSVFRWNLLSWAQSIELVPISADHRGFVEHFAPRMNSELSRIGGRKWTQKQRNKCWMWGPVDGDCEEYSDVTPWSPVEAYRRFDGTYSLHFHDWTYAKQAVSSQQATLPLVSLLLPRCLCRVSSTLRMEAVRSSETCVTAQDYIPEDNTLQRCVY